MATGTGESRGAQQPPDGHRHSTGRDLVIHDVATDYARSGVPSGWDRGRSSTHAVSAISAEARAR